MIDKKDSGDLENSIKKFVKDNGMQIINYEQFREGLNFYLDNSLNQIVETELPKIIEEDPLFFQKHNINLPKNHELHLFDLYYSKYGENGVKKAYQKGKVWFDHLHIYMTELPNELNHAIEQYKKIIEGNCFNE